MPRRVQDIVTSDRRSIREIAVKRGSSDPVSKAEKSRRQKADAGEEVEIKRIKEVKETSEKDPALKLAKPPVLAKKRKKIHPSFVLAVLGIVLLVSGAAFVTTTRLARATFTLVPKVKTVAVDRTYTFSSAPSASGSSYQLVTLSDIATTSVPATTGAAIQTKSHGTVTIYNTYSAQAQRLVAGSRLANDSGLIYRLSASVVVPGYKAAGGSNIPGVATASIVADQAGQNYDITRDSTISDFKFVAYKGSPKYNAIYARLGTEIVGGFIGSKKVVAPALVASTTDILKARLTASLLDRAQKAVPPGYIMYPTGYGTSFGPASVSGGTAYTANVSIQGTLYGVIFKRSDLVATLSGAQTIQSFGTYGYEASGLDSLSMSVINAKDFSPAKKNLLIAGFKGSISLTGSIPADEVKKKLAGASLDGMKAILKPYDAVIESGSGEVVPQWAHVPTDLSRISIVIKGN